MVFKRNRWVMWLAGLLAVTALAVGGWYAASHHQLDAAYAWVHDQIRHQKTGGGSDEGQSMPGMDMGKPGPSAVSEHENVTLPGEVQQRIGVTVGRVEKAALRMRVRTVGIVQPNETKLARVHLRTEGWVHKLFVDYTGKKVERGAPLLSIYSPQFLTTQEEYLNALRENTQSSSPLVKLARRRLELWGVSKAEIAEVQRTRQAETYLTLRSPIRGTVLAKNVFEDQYVTPQTELYEVADLSTVWVQAKVYEYELPHVAVGQPARVTLASEPGKTLDGTVVFVQPTVQEPARTTEVRVQLPNPTGALKPGMFAQVVIQHRMGEGLLVPTSAVTRTGVRDLVYRVAAPGTFLPVEVEISPYHYDAPPGEQGSRFQILKGLTDGELVVTSADFLIDSESRLQAGMGGMMPGMPGMDMGGRKGASQEHGTPANSMQGMPGMDMGGSKGTGHQHQHGMPGTDHGAHDAMPGMDHDARTHSRGKPKP